MKRGVFFILLLLAGYSFCQENPVFLKPFSPDYIHENEPFEVSCIPKVIYASGSEIQFYVMSKERLELTNAVIRANSQTIPLEFSKAFFPDYFGTIYKLTGREFVDSLFQSNTVEFVCTFSPAIGIKTAAITFGVFLDEGLSDDTESSPPQFTELIKYPSNPVEFFEEHSVGGRALNLKNNASLTISPTEEFSATKLMLEFWGSIDLLNGPFLTLRNKTTNDTLLGLQVGDLYFLKTISPRNISVFNEHYIGHNSWDYFNLLIDPQNSEVTIYVNGRKFAKVALPELLDISETKIEFWGQPGLGMHLDKLLAWDYHNTIDLAFSNKHYVNYLADSSAVLLRENFENSDLPQGEFEIGEFLISYSEPEIVKSEAPIFSRAPELNVIVYQNFYSIEWKGKDVEFADNFVLEKSYDGADYFEIYFTDADQSEEQTYFYSDPKDDSKEVIYYRVRQQNHDESTVYSSRVKIGQGEKQYFALNQNHPNPFNPVTYFSIEIFEEIEVEISVYNIVGKKVAVLHEGPLGEGLHTFSFDGSELPSGIYFYEAKSPFSSRVNKMILAK